MACHMTRQQVVSMVLVVWMVVWVPEMFVCVPECPAVAVTNCAACPPGDLAQAAFVAAVWAVVWAAVSASVGEPGHPVEHWHSTATAALASVLDAAALRCMAVTAGLRKGMFRPTA